MLYTQVRKRITDENQEVRKTHIFKFDVAEVVENLKVGKGTDDFFLGNRNGQVNKTSSFIFDSDEINFLQYVKQTKGNDLVAFLAEGQSSNKQMSHLTSFIKN
ncbi:hypothetical protein [Wolbachia pipientis]|uniref:hypothetical protein n=1 Tax=Wolbachia pipientis TaxID=955 RepID=UPI0025A3C2D8|nr:hypothetical protein [Wolbachia pipientis]MDM8335497.1 hypothetical protein [Wolbachia pipientis]